LTTIGDHLPRPEAPRPWTGELLDLINAGAPVSEMVERVFARGGPLELAGLGYRPQQHDLARAIARRIDAGDGWSMAEAPCGTGKSAAYLIPGILATLRARAAWTPDPLARRVVPPRMVASTANIALQSQIVEKDVPMVAALLGIRVRVGLLKGRSNYTCVARLNEALTVRFASANIAEIDRLAEYLAVTPGAVGDKDSLPFAMSGGAWARVSTDSEGCAGIGCVHFGPAEGHPPCYAEEAKKSAIGAEVLVVNHHLLAIAGASLGPGTLLAVDEAHALEDALRGAQTREIRKGQAHHVARLCRPIYGGQALQVVGEPIARLVEAAATWLRTTGSGQGRRPLPKGWASASGITEATFSPLLQAKVALDMLAKGQDGTDEGVRAAARAEKAAEAIASVHERCVALATGEPSIAEQEQAPGPWAMWAESDGDGATLGYCPADVSRSVLRLQRTFRAGALVSATLDFDAATIALGMINDPPAPGAPDPRPTATVKPVETLAVASPFPLAALGVLVVPRGPGPKAPEWSDWAADQTVDAVRLAGGGALVLCSSRRQMDEMVGALRGARLPWTILAQGEAGRGDLRDRFKADRDSILVGTKSFFEGLDVQGDACRLVVIDKLPFDPPGDPVEDAVGALASERANGASPFMVRALPRACALLAQAAGRLIRSATDRGALVVLDQRVLQNSSIGAAARRALPPFPVSRDLADVGRHLAGQRLTLAPLQRPVVVNGRAGGGDDEPIAIPIPTRRRSA
jgi:ATP-dependent DNA helicase DinG